MPAESGKPYLANIKNIYLHAQELLAKEAILKRTPMCPDKGSTGDAEKFIRSTNRHIDEICRSNRLSVEQMGSASQRVVLWLRFLCEGKNLAYHIETLSTLQGLLLEQQAKYLGGIKKALSPVTIMLGNSQWTFQVKQESQVTLFLVHEGFVGAPPAIVKDLAALVYSRRRPAALLKRLKMYAQSDRFQKIFNALGPMEIVSSQAAIGETYHLREVFERVNRQFFGGKLPLPGLTWSAKPTYHRFGSYNLKTDKLTISRTLDDRSVPLYVVDFVMYHELIHKVLGAKVQNGRHLTHTPEFRRLEVQFPQHEEAEKKLKALAQKEKNRQR